MNWKSLEGTGRDITYDAIPEFTWRDGGNQVKTSGYSVFQTIFELRIS
jgi:hypothetical protein